MYKLLIILCAILLLGAGCSRAEWTGFYYPDAENIGDESSWVIQPGFESIDECRDWVDEVAGNNTNFDYECGRGCRYEAKYGTTVCEITEQ